ncbi:MAG TPA: TlpA disulfide reductase family protein [Candidatus Eremiobacteraceae bacterium]
MSTEPRAPVAGWIIAAALFAIAAVIFVTSLQRPAAVPLTGNQTSGSARVGMAAPDVDLVGLDGRHVSFAAYRGKPVWVNFFATWCPPCKEELPEIEKRYQLSHARGLVVLGVDQQETPALIKPFIARFGLRYPVLIDNGQGAITYDLIALPTSVFIDRNGVVRFIQLGEMSPLLMDTALAKIL